MFEITNQPYVMKCRMDQNAYLFPGNCHASAVIRRHYKTATNRYATKHTFGANKEINIYIYLLCYK